MNVTIKPGLTIDVMPETSSGIEPVWPQVYTRRVMRTGIAAVDHMIIAASSSKMDWDEEELITQPGIGSNPCAEVALPDPSDGIARAFGPYPQIVGESIAKTDRCYLCARGQYLTRFFRDPNDSVITCVSCLYDHLGWELHEDGTLTPVKSES
jgi:hypothetical protein